MKIINHLLCHDDDSPYPFEIIPNYSKNSLIIPEYLVMHYTAGTTPQQAINWFKNPAAYVSAHLIIGRDGSITQLVPFDREAWHAGYSQWANRTRLNKYSIGIELDNFGYVYRVNNEWTRSNVVLPDEDVIEARHKLDYSTMGWHKYSDLQIATALEVARILFAEYRLIDVVGHDDISTNHKVDPGPAFPMEGLRSQILDLTAEQLLRYRTTIRLILRSDAGDVYPAQIIGYLPIGKLFEVVARKSGWAQVKSVEESGAIAPVQGWLPERHLKREH